jgi:hypothetical protein
MATAKQLQVNKVPQLTRELSKEETVFLQRAWVIIAERFILLTLTLLRGSDREFLSVGPFVCYFARAVGNANRVWVDGFWTDVRLFAVSIEQSGQNLGAMVLEEI